MPAGAEERTVTVEEHLDRILSDVEPFAPTAVPLLEALGLVCAEDVVAEIALPPFDNSAMDGYAVRLADVAGANEAEPVLLRVADDIGAGQAGDRGGELSLAAGAAAKIMTGARVPAGTEAVVPYEWTDRGSDKVTISQVPEAGQHVRPAGDDVAVGDLLLRSGQVLGPRQLGLLAAVGHPTVLARPRPRVAILATGSELRDPGTALGPDSIYDGNSWMLAAAVLRAGGVPLRVGIVPDQPERFLAVLAEQLADADLVLTSGGVSQGDYDVVKEALHSRGVWFGPVAMQPAKPQGYGRVDGTPVVTLPGNPVSSYISFEVFVLPALRKMMGRTPYARPPVEARLTKALGSPAGRRQFRRGEPGVDEQGRYVAPVGGPASHLVGDLANANCLFVIPEDVTAVAEGATVPVLLLDEDY
jgi:molybdopterin molybdotransferase